MCFPMPLAEDVIDKMAALITAAFGLVAALAWNCAIQALFREYFGTQETIAVMATLRIGRAAARAKSMR